MVRWPGMVTAGSRSASLAATYDIFATMLAMGGVVAPTDRVILMRPRLAVRMYRMLNGGCYDSNWFTQRGEIPVTDTRKRDLSS